MPPSSLATTCLLKVINSQIQSTAQLVLALDVTLGRKCHLSHPIIHIRQAHNQFSARIQNLEGETQCIFCQCQYKALLFTHKEIKREIPLIIGRSSHLHSFCETYSCMSKSGIQLDTSVLPNMDELISWPFAVDSRF